MPTQAKTADRDTPAETVESAISASPEFTAEQLVDADISGRVSFRSLVAVSAAFWLYVAASNVLYSHSMQVTFARTGFSPWGERVVQHLILFPPLVGAYWISLRVGWTPFARIALQVALAVVFASLPYFSMELAAIVSNLFTPPAVVKAMAGSLPSGQAALWMADFVSFLLTYWFGLALVTALAWYKRFHESQLHVATLREEWSAARLSALRLQLSPHTLFNLLHTIRVHVRSDPDNAEDMIVQLAGLLRRLLRVGQREFCLLGEELHFVSSYLELQRQRFSDRLSVEVPNPDRQPAFWVPSLILQPLIENAVVHGLAGHEDPVEIRVESLPTEHSLILRVTNTTGPGRALRVAGIGLNNVRERLRVHFGSEAELSMNASDGTVWVVQISMPKLSQLTAARAGS